MNGSPAVGDVFAIRPGRGAAEGLRLAISDPAGLAAGLPISASAAAGNTGTSVVANLSVIDPTNGGLTNAVTIQFTSPTSYTLNGSGNFSFTPGNPIEVNGWRLALDGPPSTGDEFSVAASSGTVGDNRNALALADALDGKLLGGGSASIAEDYANLVAVLSTNTRQAEINLQAQTSITDGLIAEQQAASGVNLDEEAANLLRYQQSYQAAAQFIGVADNLFQTLISAVRR